MVLSQNYIVKIAIFDQKCRHRKEFSYRNFKDTFGNGMACGQRLQHGKTLILTLVFIRIILVCQYATGCVGMLVCLYAGYASGMLSIAGTAAWSGTNQPPRKR